MSGRVIYYYERTLSAQVNDIEHIESQSLAGYGVVKVFFQPGVNINSALAQITAASQTVLKQLPPGITPPYVLSFNASSVPILQLALSADSMSQSEIFDAGQNFIRPQLATVKGAAVPSPYGGKVRQVQVDLDQDKLQAYGVSSQEVVDAIAKQNLITPVGTEKVGTSEYVIALNDAPKAIAELNDLPIKQVNGATVFVSDVAFVHDGSPPQTNIVHVDGKPAVLMTILKAGSASTLDVINGVKALLPRLRETLPKSLHLQAVGDQSAFVKAAVSSVVFEGVVAAALTGLMILIFLGSWRSTLIITISIPLAILASVATLSALGQTINVMTLGGLALAVGILVDDATVTIENVNWHLEQGKDIETAIMDGARQIVIPATVSLLCICIVFVPMFGLGGVAGYLFKPMAEAVVFALIASYILSRTLVATLARFLLAGQVVHGHDQVPPPTRNPLVMFQRGFERRFEATRGFYARLLTTALGARWLFPRGFSGRVWSQRLSGSRLFSDATSSRPSRAPRSPCTFGCPPARASSRLRARSWTSNSALREIAPPGAVVTTSSTISVCRSPASTWPIAIPARLERPTPTCSFLSRKASRLRRPRSSRACARNCRIDFPASPSRSPPPTWSRRFSISDFPRRSTSRSSAPTTWRGTALTRTNSCKDVSRVTGIADARIHASLSTRRRSTSTSTACGPAQVGVNEKDVAGNAANRAGGQHSDRADCSGSIRRTACPIRSSRRRRNTGSSRCQESGERSGLGRLAIGKFLAAWPPSSATSPTPWSRHYAVQPVHRHICRAIMNAISARCRHDIQTDSQRGQKADLPLGSLASRCAGKRRR